MKKGVGKGPLIYDSTEVEAVLGTGASESQIGIA